MVAFLDVAALNRTPITPRFTGQAKATASSRGRLLTTAFLLSLFATTPSADTGPLAYVDGVWPLAVSYFGHARRTQSESSPAGSGRPTRNAL
jgi:hypothetical protein